MHLVKDKPSTKLSRGAINARRAQAFAMNARSVRAAVVCAAMALHMAACVSAPNATSARAPAPSHTTTLVDCSFVAGTLELAQPVLTRDAQRPLADSGLSELVVRLAGRDGSRVEGAMVALYTDSLVPLHRVTTWTFSDSLGIAALPSLAAGEYVMRVRHVGFKALSRSVRTRSGFSDTLRITAVWCGSR